MSFLDKTGLTTLWNKIKTLMSKYLPLSGGTITGDLKLGSKDKTVGFYVYDSSGNECKLNVEKAVQLGVFDLTQINS